jgi:hypothetical protein
MPDALCPLPWLWPLSLSSLELRNGHDMVDMPISPGDASVTSRHGHPKISIPRVIPTDSFVTKSRWPREADEQPVDEDMSPLT